MQQQGNRRYQTSSVVCNPPFAADNKLVQCLQSSICPSRACRCMDQSNSQFIGCQACQAHVFPQNCTFPLGDHHLHVTNCSSSQAHSSSRPVQPFLYGYNALTMGKNPKLPLPLRILPPCQKKTESQPQATCTKNLVKITRVVPKISSQTDRQTHRQTYSSQYFANAPEGGSTEQQRYVC